MPLTIETPLPPPNHVRLEMLTNSSTPEFTDSSGQYVHQKMQVVFRGFKVTSIEKEDNGEAKTLHLLCTGRPEDKFWGNLASGFILVGGQGARVRFAKFQDALPLTGPHRVSQSSMDVYTPQTKFTARDVPMFCVKPTEDSGHPHILTARMNFDHFAMYNGACRESDDMDFDAKPAARREVAEFFLKTAQKDGTSFLIPKEPVTFGEFDDFITGLTEELSERLRAQREQQASPTPPPPSPSTSLSTSPDSGDPSSESMGSSVDSRAESPWPNDFDAAGAA